MSHEELRTRVVEELNARLGTRAIQFGVYDRTTMLEAGVEVRELITGRTVFQEYPSDDHSREIAEVWVKLVVDRVRRLR